MNAFSLALPMILGVTSAWASPAVLPLPKSFVAQKGTMWLKGDRIDPKSLDIIRDKTLADEEYRLSVLPTGIKIRAAAGAGAFYAIKTLEQLAQRENGGFAVPCCEVEDAPRFRWRGFMLDESRHFFGKDEVKKVIEWMSAYKLNVLHWHLTDGNGWRIQIDAFPELTRKGATRRITRLRAQRFFRDVRTGVYGPFFYSKDDIREIVAYARARNVRIVPEIEFPGHEGSAVEAYPDLFCFGDGSKPTDPSARIRGDEICLGNDFTFAFYEKVLAEVAEMFPDAYVHIGGDECTGNNWKACARCQKRMEELGVADVNAYQEWGVKRICELLAKKGRKAIGWDPVFVNRDLPQDVSVMCYRGIRHGINAAIAGHETVMAPAGLCYLDFPQGLRDDSYEYQVFSNPVRVSDLYRFNPLFAVPKEAQDRIIGGECPLWTEFVCTPQELEWRIWPRLCALAEALWTHPDPKTSKATEPDFMRRLDVQIVRMKKAGLNVAPCGPLAPTSQELLPGVTVTHRDGLHPILAADVNPSDIEFRRDAEVPAGECEVVIVQTSIKARVSDAGGEARALDIVRRLSEPKQGGVLSVRCGTFKTW